MNNIIENIKIEYKNWCKNNPTSRFETHSDEIINRYLKALTRIDEELNSGKSIFNVKDINEFEKLDKVIREQEKFNIYDNEPKGEISAALSDYKHFLEDRENIMDGEKTTKDYVDILEKSKNIILHGAPGTGKTYLAKQIAAYMISNNKSQY